jgi:DNA-3-methyladenine glycosylase II
MSVKPIYWNKAKIVLSKKDKIMKKLINNYKDGSLITRNDIFFSLCKSIVGQQISVAAANSVFLKFEKKCKSKITAKVVNKLSSTSLKTCGLSRQKIKGIKELAKKIVNKKFKPNLIKKMSDEEAIEYLSELRQIGRWSSEMILLFTYNRSNIWPLQDIGLLRAVSNNYNKKYFPPKSFLLELYKKFTPYCSVATWYLWRSIDDEPIQY